MAAQAGSQVRDHAAHDQPVYPKAYFADSLDEDLMSDVRRQALRERLGLTTL